MRSVTGDYPAMTYAVCTIISIKRRRIWLQEGTTTRGRNRTSYRGRDCCVAQDHEATSAKDALPTADPCNEDWKRMEGKQSVFGRFLAKRDGIISPTKRQQRRCITHLRCCHIEKSEEGKILSSFPFCREPLFTSQGWQVQGTYQTVLALLA